MDAVVQIQQQTGLEGQPPAFVVPAIGLIQIQSNLPGQSEPRQSEQVQAIPHPNGNQTASFTSLEDALKAVFYAGYEAEFEGRRYSRPSPSHKNSLQQVTQNKAALRPWQQEWQACQKALLEALNDKEKQVVVASVQALGELREPALSKALLPFMQEEEGDVRQAVAVALSRQGVGVLPVLLQQLAKAETGLPGQAGFRIKLTVLATLQELARVFTIEQLQRALPALQTLLKDSHWLVRQQSALVCKTLAIPKEEDETVSF